MAAAVMTYQTLFEDIALYAERDDANFATQIPRLILLGENRIASEARGLGFMNPITGNLIMGNSSLAKPARWRETVSFQIGTGTTNSSRKFLLERDYEFCRVYWPNASTTGEPKYYADWDYEHWLIAGTPEDDYPYEIIYHQMPQPLDSANSTNWTTQYAPQLLLYACLLETQPYLKRDDRIPVFQAQYDRALKQVEFEQKRRLADRSASTSNG